MGCTVAVGGAEEATATVLNTWDKQAVPIALESNIMHNKNISPSMGAIGFVGFRH